jgi:hypothetical protein
MPPDQVTFEKEVNDLLAEERRRTAGGAPLSAASWDLAGKGDPLDLMFAESFRLQPCLFAFHLLPDALLRDCALPAATTSSELEVLIDRLWQKASQLCEAAGERPLPPDRPTAGFHQLNAGRFLVIVMPAAFSAPEPLYLAVPATNPECIYLVESASARPDRVFVASINAQGLHEILGTLDEVSLDSFLEVFDDSNGRPEVSRRSMPDSLKQLMAYAAVAERARKLA